MLTLSQNPLVLWLAIFAILIITFCLLFVNWKLCVKSVLILLVLEGAIRKWLFPQISDFIYFLKDAIIIVAYIKFFLVGLPLRTYLKHYPILIFLICLTLLACGLQILNLHLGSPIVGLLGFKFYLLYMPMMFIVPYLFDSSQELFIFLKRYLLLVVPIFALALLQFESPPNSIFNIYARSSIDGGVATSGFGKVRVTGTFSYISGFGAYIITSTALLLPLIAIRSSMTWRLSSCLMFIALCVSALMTGSRGVVFPLVAISIGFIVFHRLYKLINLSTRFLLPIVITASLLPLFFPEQIDSFLSRIDSTEEMGHRAVEGYVTTFAILPIIPPFGYGIGATHQATAILRNRLNLPDIDLPFPVEVEPARILMELGIIGFTIWYALRIAIVIYLWRTFLRLKFSEFLSNIALSLALYLTIGMIGPIVVNVTSAIYFWFVAGFIFLLPKLEERDHHVFRELQKSHSNTLQK